MKKYIIAVLLLFIPCVTYALTMCARDNSLVISLVPGTFITKNYKNSEGIWNRVLNYGTILGESTCLSEEEAERLSKDTPKGLKGVDDKGVVRDHVACRLTHPALSDWIIVNIRTDCSVHNAMFCSDVNLISTATYINAIGQ